MKPIRPKSTANTWTHPLAKKINRWGKKEEKKKHMRIQSIAPAPRDLQRKNSEAALKWHQDGRAAATVDRPQHQQEGSKTTQTLLVGGQDGTACHCERHFGRVSRSIICPYCLDIVFLFICPTRWSSHRQERLNLHTDVHNQLSELRSNRGTWGEWVHWGTRRTWEMSCQAMRRHNGDTYMLLSDRSWHII